jgi:acetolactate synthase-1/2/3 large subunit
VEYIFGYPGGAALHIYDAIFRQQRVEHILVRHSRRRRTWRTVMPAQIGRPGVVLVTSVRDERAVARHGLYGS